jgi:hypothetical protein
MARVAGKAVFMTEIASGGEHRELGLSHRIDTQVKPLVETDPMPRFLVPPFAITAHQKLARRNQSEFERDAVRQSQR